MFCKYPSCYASVLYIALDAKLGAMERMPMSLLTRSKANWCFLGRDFSI